MPEKENSLTEGKSKISEYWCRLAEYRVNKQIINKKPISKCEMGFKYDKNKY